MTTSTAGKVGVGRIISRNPAAPEEVVAEVASLDRSAVSAKIRAADGAWREWAADASARAVALHRWADRIAAVAEELAALICDEVGKPISEARAEVVRGESILRYYAQTAFDPIGEVLPGAGATSRVTVARRPVGVVTAICPWNFPLAIPLWKLAPALACGNAVLFKPASAAVGVGQRLIELSRPDVPEALLAFIPLRGADVNTLLDADRIGAVSFTGSSAVGRSVVARVAARGGAVQAEMGGQNASIVLDDADLDLAAATITGAAMGYAGQKCTATRRVVVHRSVADALAERLIARVEALQVGNPRAEATDVGPLIHEEARHDVEGAVRATLGRGARLLAGGSGLEACGWFYRPTLVAVTDESDLFVHEETFGPVAAMLVVDTDDDAIRIANATRYGLSGAVFGEDVDRATAVANRLNAGMIRVNGSTTGADYWAPFGGDGASSYGPREQGRAALAFYTTTRTVTMHRTPSH